MWPCRYTQSEYDVSTRNASLSTLDHYRCVVAMRADMCQEAERNDEACSMEQSKGGFGERKRRSLCEKKGVLGTTEVSDVQI
jgi:hypothetical protein